MLKYVAHFMSSLLNCDSASKRLARRRRQTYGPDNTDGIVTIKMKADRQQIFGFNLRIEAEKNNPVVVSKVILNSPADTCLPQLNEGDQILSVNNNDIRGLKQDEIEKLIQRAAESSDRELNLRVRQRVYDGEEEKDAAFSQFSKTTNASPRLPRRDTLSDSIVLLSEGLEDESLIFKFESIYRRKPGETTEIAKLHENLRKNRYRDISPYDATRVVLQSCTSGDYINASHVNMEIPTSKIVNKYIATQGPLPTTCIEFWQMVWEQKSTLIVMLTTLLERGRLKCHKYWPDKNKTETYGQLEITCVVEVETTSLVHRELHLINKEESTERKVIQMQYVAWPDHGVPVDASDFLAFVGKVRNYREGTDVPIIVHCSAGIGRTGVLILMETAMCLIEADEPVYPIEVVLEMRRQRAMLIQTTSQFKFVCEAILKVFKEGIVKPLEAPTR
ncbi:tyrosine-protein phosphatase non-receptor type 4-like isoform X1 [Limulus polyphemus]|uniref:Tyrosine-protein phosphatase non-receptor type 4-like isoform X1 n=1 Tax=Limulus polyphemus TaxID=6850 RepID=A0ABM1B307_LIMPO|nr:tyrosine-protein phosphatase non-receptor type 4-like isoform X1 [Limulus polyphemus]